MAKTKRGGKNGVISRLAYVAVAVKRDRASGGVGLALVR